MHKKRALPYGKLHVCTRMHKFAQDEKKKSISDLLALLQILAKLLLEPLHPTITHPSGKFPNNTKSDSHTSTFNQPYIISLDLWKNAPFALNWHSYFWEICGSIEGAMKIIESSQTILVTFHWTMKQQFSLINEDGNYFCNRICVFVHRCVLNSVCE